MPHTQSIAITPLTPIHIGCNTHFEPTRYFIDNGWLYYFDPKPTQLFLAQKDQDEFTRLGTYVRPTYEQGCTIQRFVYQQRALFKSATQCIMPVAHTIEKIYLQRVGAHTPRQREQQERPSHPRLNIERHIFDTHNLEPFIPGSLLKSTLRKAILGTTHKKQKPSLTSEKHPSRESAIDPLRALHIQHATSLKCARKVLVCTNSLNKPAAKSAPVKQTQATTASANTVQITRREMILGGQYRQLQSEFVFAEPSSDKTETLTSENDFTNLAKTINAYFRPKFNVELHRLEQEGYTNNAWIQGLKQLFNETLRPAMDEGRIMLLRIGQYNPKGQLLPDAAWFAYPDEKSTHTIFPLGWIVIECQETPPIPTLATWCKQQTKPNTAPIWASIEEERELVAEKRVALEQAQRQAEERAATLAAAEQTRQAELNALSPQLRKLEEFAHEFEAAPPQANTGTSLFQRTWELLQEALSWSHEEQKQCETRLTPLIKTKFPHLGKREKEVKACLRQLREGELSHHLKG